MRRAGHAVQDERRRHRSAARRRRTGRPAGAARRRRRPIRPSAWIRVPTGGAAAPVGSRSSTAADASWTTIRRPVASRSVAGAVTIASMATARSVILRARAIEIGRDRPPLPGVGDPEPAAGRGRAPPRPATTHQVRRRRGPRSGSRRARPTGGPLADDPDDPVGRADLERRRSIRLETSAMTLTGDAPSRSRTKREVAAGRLLRLGGQTPGRRDEAAFDRLGETGRRDRDRRGQAAGPEDADVGLGRADLELAVWRRQLPGDLEPGARG